MTIETIDILRGLQSACALLNNLRNETEIVFGPYYVWDKLLRARMHLDKEVETLLAEEKEENYASSRF